MADDVFITDDVCYMNLYHVTYILFKDTGGFWKYRGCGSQSITLKQVSTEIIEGMGVSLSQN